MSFKMHKSILYPHLFSQLLVRLMTAISLERWSHYQGFDRWRRKMLHLGWCDRPSVWPIFGGSASDGEGAGGYFCLIGFNNVETIWIIGTCWILVVLLQCNANRAIISKVDTLQALEGRSIESKWRVKNKCTIIKCPRFRKVEINKNIRARNNLFWSALRRASLRHNCFCQTATNRNSH